MNRTLLLLVIGVLAVVPPAWAQYVYLDSNGDGLNYDREVTFGNFNVPADLLTPASTAVDVYFVTNQTGDGDAASCDEDTGKSLTMISYEAVLQSVGPGFVTFNGWTDNLGFAFGIITAGDNTFVTGGQEAWFGRGTAAPGVAPGTYKVGTISISVTGTPGLIFKSSSGLHTNAQTAFGSECPGARFDNTVRLGPFDNTEYDFYHSFGTTYPLPVVSTTWGKIKARYR